MFNRLTNLFLLLLFLIAFSGCTFIEDIFKAGAWVGALAALIVVGLIFLIVRAFKS